MLIPFVRPNEDFLETQFNDKTVGTNLPKNYIKPICQGIEQRALKGPQIGAPFVGIDVDILDGKIHQ